MATEILLRLPAVRAKVGMARASIYAGVAAGTFPRPVKIGARAVAWPSSLVDAWIEQRIAASRTITTRGAK